MPCNSDAVAQTVRKICVTAATQEIRGVCIIRCTVRVTGEDWNRSGEISAGTARIFAETRVAMNRRLCYTTRLSHRSNLPERRRIRR